MTNDGPSGCCSRAAVGSGPGFIAEHLEVATIQKKATYCCDTDVQPRRFADLPPKGSANA